MMIAKPSFYIDSAEKNLMLFATSVLPSLFPFYFFSLMLTKIGGAKLLSKIAKKPVQLLFNTPKESAYIFFLSVLSGYPVGASTTYEFFKAGIINQDEAKSICAFASTSGPIFILGTVGSAIFDNYAIGLIVFFSHYIGAILNGIIFRLRKKHLSGVGTKTINTPKNDVDSLVANSMASATTSMLMVGGYIVIAGMLIDTLTLVGLDAFLIDKFGEKIATPLLSLVYGLIEMTRGSVACVDVSYSPLAVALTSAIVSFGGMSVTMQNYTYLSKCGVKLSQIILRKIVQSALSFLLAFCIGMITL